MTDYSSAICKGVVRLPARDIPLPVGISEAAREAMIAAQARQDSSPYPANP